MSETNGTHTSKATLEQIREETRRARALSRLRQAQVEAELWESSNLGMGWGPGWADLMDPFANRRDDFSQMYLPNGAGQLYGRQDGRNRPFIWTDIDLDRSRSMSRWLATRNPFAIGILSTIRNYLVKRGYTWEVHPTPGMEDDPRAAQLARRCQKIIDEFSDLNSLASRERSSCWRAVRDGEVFVRLFAQEDGRTLVRFVEPEQVREQPGADSNCAFGIETEPGDIERPLAYHVTYDGTEFDCVPASEMCHLKRNVDECVKRGLSDFYATQDALDGVYKLLRNMREAGAVQAAIAWIEQFESSTQSQVASHIGAVKDLNRPNIQGPISGRQIDYQRFEPGTIVKVGKGKQYLAAPLAGNTSNHVTIAQACLRALGVRWGIPEHMISGDASNNNYASILVTGSPFVNAIECDQDDFGRFFLRWRWIALRIACESGRLPGYTFADIQDLVDIHYTPPEVAVSNESEQASIDHQDIAAGVMSIQTRRARRGLDDDQEERNLAEKPPTRVQGKFTDLDSEGNPVTSGSEEGGDPDQGLAEEIAHRRKGEVWKGPSGRYFTVNDEGHVVPAKAPGQDDQPDSTEEPDEQDSPAFEKPPWKMTREEWQGGFSGKGGREEFIRFGGMPEGGRSVNGLDDTLEDGVSAFRLQEDSKGPYFIAGASGDDWFRDNQRPGFLLRANEIGTGSDGEPVLDPDTAKAVARIRFRRDGRKWRIEEIDHEDSIRTAIAAGKNVPASVIADYPQLARLIDDSNVGESVPTYADLLEAAKREKGEVWKGPSGRYFTVNQNGRVVPAKNPSQGEKKDSGGSKKADKPGKADPAEIKSRIEQMRKGGKVSAEDAKNLADSLMGLTTAQLTQLKKDLGLKASGAKAELAKKLAERALATAGVGKEKDQGKDEGREEDGKGEVKAADRQPEPASAKQPKPPQEGYTGTDTLGRKWQNGSLAGETEALPAQATHFDATRKLDVKKTFGVEIETLQPGELEVLKQSSGLAANPHLLGATKIYVFGDSPVLKKLADRGLLDSIGKLTTKGRVAYLNATGHTLRSGQLRPPLTKAHVTAWTSLYAGATFEQRQAMCNHLGINASDAADPVQFRQQIESQALEQINGSMQANIRGSQSATSRVTELSNLETADSVRATWKATGQKWKAANEEYMALISKPTKSRKDWAEIEKARKNADLLEQECQKASKTYFGHKDEVTKQVKRLLAQPEGKAIHVSLGSQADDVSPVARESCASAVEWANGIVAKAAAADHLPAANVSSEKEGYRACYSSETQTIHATADCSKSTAVHELGHHLEHHLPGVAAAAHAFLAYRTRGEKLQPLNKLIGPGYRADEAGKKDNFDLAMGDTGAYVGKSYGGLATEIVSMGLEKLYTDPQDFAAKDPEYCAFVIGILDGSLRYKELPDG